MKKRFSEEQIIGCLKQAEGGVPVKELCRKHGFSNASFYTWRAEFGGKNVSEAKREAVATMREKTESSARRACQLVGIARSVLAYQRSADPWNAVLATRIAELAAERRRFGYRRLHILLRREGS